MHELSHSGNFQSFSCFQPVDYIHLPVSLHPMPSFDHIFHNSIVSYMADDGCTSLINKKHQVPGFITLRNSLKKLEGTLAHSHSVSKRLQHFKNVWDRQQILKNSMKLIICCLARLSNIKAQVSEYCLRGKFWCSLLKGRPNSVHQLLSQRSTLHFPVSSEKAIWTLWKITSC